MCVWCRVIAQLCGTGCLVSRPGPLRRSDAVDERRPRRPGEDGGGGTRESQPEAGSFYLLRGHFVLFIKNYYQVLYVMDETLF